MTGISKRRSRLVGLVESRLKGSIACEWVLSRLSIPRWLTGRLQISGWLLEGRRIGAEVVLKNVEQLFTSQPGGPQLNNTRLRFFYRNTCTSSERTITHHHRFHGWFQGWLASHVVSHQQSVGWFEGQEITILTSHLQSSSIWWTYVPQIPFTTGWASPLSVLPPLPRPSLSPCLRSTSFFSSPSCCSPSLPFTTFYSSCFSLTTTSWDSFRFVLCDVVEDVESWEELLLLLRLL